MKPEDVKRHFNTGYNFRKKTGMSDNTLHNWVKWGYVPYCSQKWVEKVTNNELVAEWDEKELEARYPKDMWDKYL